MNDLKKVNFKEFYDQGYLQELNRQFLHPLGMMLQITSDENDPDDITGFIVDLRKIPEGLVYGDITINSDGFKEKMENVKKQWGEKERARKEAYGFMVQDKNPVRVDDHRHEYEVVEMNHQWYTHEQKCKICNYVNDRYRLEDMD